MSKPVIPTRHCHQLLLWPFDHDQLIFTGANNQHMHIARFRVRFNCHIDGSGVAQDASIVSRVSGFRRKGAVLLRDWLLGLHRQVRLHRRPWRVPVVSSVLLSLEGKRMGASTPPAHFLWLSGGETLSASFRPGREEIAYQ
jgi:hypothetical protein